MDAGVVVALAAGKLAHVCAGGHYSWIPQLIFAIALSEIAAVPGRK
jgi:hypothetical protein